MSHTGVSRGLGLAESVAGQESPPAPPPPRSWTPSPPFQPNESHQNPSQEPQPQVHNNTRRSGVATYSSRGHNSPYNPRFNTPNTNLDSSSHSPPSSSPIYVPLVLRRLPGERRPRYTSINPYWMELPPPQRQPRKSRRTRSKSRNSRHKETRASHRSSWNWTESWPRSPHIYFKETHERAISSGDVDELSDEAPAACSSHHGSPSHPLPCPHSASRSSHDNFQRPGPSYCGTHSLNLSQGQFYGPASWGRRYLGPGAYHHYHHQQHQRHQHQQQQQQTLPVIQHQRSTRKRWPRPDTPIPASWRAIPLSEEEEEEGLEDDGGTGQPINPQHPQQHPTTPRSSRPHRQVSHIL